MKHRNLIFAFVIAIYLIVSGCASTTPLIKASKEGDYQAVKKLVQSGVYINEADSNGDTPLLSAIRAGKTDVAKYLIESEADIKVKNKQGFDALLCAVDAVDVVDYGRLEIIKSLIKKGANLESKDLSGRTPLILAALNVTIYGLTNIDVIKLLIKSGADLNAKSPEGETLLDLALSYKRGDIVDNMIRAGVKLWTPEAGKARLFFVGIQLWDYAIVSIEKQSKKLNMNKYTGLAYIDVDTGKHTISISGEQTSSIDAVAGQIYYLEVSQNMALRALHYVMVRMQSFVVIPLKEVDAKKVIKELLQSKEIK